MKEKETKKMSVKDVLESCAAVAIVVYVAVISYLLVDAKIQNAENYADYVSSDIVVAMR